MTFIQIASPNPNVSCKPGWCLAYVKDAFGLNAVYPSATAAWNASTTKHRDMNFPGDVWIPLWFSMITEPLGHVVLRAPDGSVYSTSDNSTTAKHHPNLNHLMEYYAYYGMPLTYLGWTEDVEGQTVIKEIEEEFMNEAQLKQFIHETNLFNQKVIQAERETIVNEVRAHTAWNASKIMDVVQTIPDVSDEVVNEIKEQLAQGFEFTVKAK